MSLSTFCRSSDAPVVGPAGFTLSSCPLPPPLPPQSGNLGVLREGGFSLALYLFHPTFHLNTGGLHAPPGCRLLKLTAGHLFCPLSCPRPTFPQALSAEGPEDWMERVGLRGGEGSLGPVSSAICISETLPILPESGGVPAGWQSPRGMRRRLGREALTP